MLRLLGTISDERRGEVTQELRRGATIGRDYVLLVVLSCAIATFGLALNSGAVIIGAMLISPLMSPILGLAMAIVRGAIRDGLRALLTLVLGMVMAVALSTLLGQFVIPGGLDLVEQLPSEIIGRTRPTLFDLAVALAGGMAAAYALVQPRLSATLPGVAIATALMPPVCVVGLGLALGRVDVAGGALLLFLANFAAIIFASSAVFLSLGFAPADLRPRRGVLPAALLLTSGLLLLVSVPLGVFMVRIIQDAQEANLIRATLTEQLAAITDSTLVGFDREPSAKQLEIVATVRSPRGLTYAEAIRMQREVATQLQKTVALKLLVIPVTRLDALVPPTLTPTLVAGASPVSTATPPATVTDTPSPTPTLTPSPTLEPSVTAVTTATPTPSPAPTATPGLTPLSYAVVGATGGLGVNVHRAPGVADVLAAMPDGTIVQLTGRESETDAILWREAVLPDGRVGWLAAQFLIPYDTYLAPT